MEFLKIGWAEESLLPKKKIMLCGQFYERISDRVDTEITVTAMAAERGDQRMIMVSADVGEISHALLRRAREKFRALNGEVDPEEVIVSATHTHTSHTMAPGEEDTSITSTIDVIREYSGGELGYEEVVEADDSVMTAREGYELVSEKIALAADKAWKNRRKARVANEFGRAAVGMCRRVSYDDGTAQMWGDCNTANFVSLEGGNDSGIELLYVFDETDALTGIVANIACPAQILEQRNVISADYWGKAKALLREKLGGGIYLLALCGAAGDQCPRDLVRWVEPETPILDPNVKRPHVIKHRADPSMYDLSGCARVGKRVANEILSVYEELGPAREITDFRHEILRLDLPLRKVTMTERDAAETELRKYIDRNRGKKNFNFEDIAKMHVYAGILLRFREQQTQETVRAECHVIRLGPVAFFTCPFELYLDYGNRVKARSYAEQTFITQLCCGTYCYLPTEKAEKAGHYSAYVSSGYVGHEGGDLLVRNAITHINRMWEEEDA